MRYLYFASLGGALGMAPWILADGFVLIPSLMMFMVAIGPLNELVGKRPTCAQCGAIAERLRALRLVVSHSRRRAS